MDYHWKIMKKNRPISKWWGKNNRRCKYIQTISSKLLFKTVLGEQRLKTLRDLYWKNYKMIYFNKERWAPQNGEIYKEQ